MGKSRIYFAFSSNRKEGTARCLELFGTLDYKGKTVFIKPNFNTADPAPGSTHNDTLEQLLSVLHATSPAKLTVGERSGPAVTAQVMAEKGIPQLCEKFGAELVNFDELDEDGWISFNKEGLHWPEGFRIPAVVSEADAVVATCCLKTHGFGGIYSNSLKLAVGLTPKNFQTLHNSADMRKMIAELNLAYTPDFILVDAVEVFTDGGPMSGVRKNANIMYIGSDRVALDAVGLAILKSLGSNSAIMDTPVFKQEQIARAVELGLGVSSADEIEIITDDAKSSSYAAIIMDILHSE